MMKIGMVVIATVCVMAGGPVAAGAEEAGAKLPCAAPEHLQFDFWVGSWRVTDAEGVFQGTNRIEKILGGCALQENWTGAKGVTGRSFNIYASGRGVWHQTWVDSNGLLLLLDGGVENGRMVLRGQTPARAGKESIEHEISWEERPDGSVRQVWRISRDGGSTWNDAFVGLYHRQTE
jgi:hypothetical protein